MPQKLIREKEFKNDTDKVFAVSAVGMGKR